MDGNLSHEIPFVNRGKGGSCQGTWHITSCMTFAPKDAGTKTEDQREKKEESGEQSEAGLGDTELTVREAL